MYGGYRSLFTESFKGLGDPINEFWTTLWVLDLESWVLIDLVSWDGEWTLSLLPSVILRVSVLSEKVDSMCCLNE